MDSVYDINGDDIETVYMIEGTDVTEVYDILGNEISLNDMDEYIDGRTLVYEDDFDELDMTKWSYEIGLVRNQSRELQCYRYENVSIENSKLVLTAKRESYGGKEWTSGSITGQQIQEFGYGRVEAKIKFPNIVGAFGAFWMLGSNFWIEFTDGGMSTEQGVLWPKCGELDIVETIPGDATSMQTNLFSYTGNTLGKGYSPNIDSGKWHVYAVERTDTYIASFIDGVEYKRWIFADLGTYLTQAYLLPMFIVLNLAVGLAGGTPLPTTNEMKMYVDWVRVYDSLESD